MPLLFYLLFYSMQSGSYLYLLHFLLISFLMISIHIVSGLSFSRILCYSYFTYLLDYFGIIFSLNMPKPFQVILFVIFSAIFVIPDCSLKYSFLFFAICLYIYSFMLIYSSLYSARVFLDTFLKIFFCAQITTQNQKFLLEVKTDNLT